MNFIQDNNLITDIKLVLESGMIWNKAASLDDESWFEIYTTDSTAAVRWTIFWVQKNQNNSEIIVQKWTVAIKQNIISSAETIKSYINNQDTDSIPTITVPMIPGLIDIENAETVIKVENNDSEKWASVWSIAKFSTWSMNDIPTIIKDDVMSIVPILNDNISIVLKEYSYSLNNGINIQLEIPEKVYKSTDFILMNSTAISYKNQWWNWLILSGSTYTQTLDNNTEAISNNLAQWNSNESLISYIENEINTNKNYNFTIQLWKKSLNGKSRLTNEVSFTLIEDKHYENNEEKEENIIDEDEIKRESEKKWEIVRWTEESCNWFDFDNISGETELCASADTDLKTNGWNIVAFAPYDNAGDLNLYFSWWIMKNNYWDADNWRESFITDFSCEWSGTQCTNTFNDFWPDATDYINNESFVSFNNNTNLIKNKMKFCYWI